MKKILFFSTIPSSIKEFSLDFMKYLRSQGFIVEAAAGVAKQTEYIRSQGFVCYDFQIPRGIDPIGDYNAFRAIRKIIREGHFDVVHTQTAKAGFIGRLAAYLEKVPLIIHTAHAWPFHPYLAKWKKYYYLYLEKIAAKLCDAIIVDTKTVQEYGNVFQVASSEKVHQIYMGIDLERFCSCSEDEKKLQKKYLNLPSEKIIVGSIARLVADKGIEVLIECANRLQNNPDFLFILLGEGELRPVFEKQIKDRGLENKFILAGYINDVSVYYRAFDIFFLPTLREGFGVVFAEAMSSAVPVIASDIEPLNNEIILNGTTGFLAKPDDVETFTRNLQKLLDSTLRRKMGEASRDHVAKNFNIHKINQQTLELYQHLWNKKFQEKF